MVRWPGELRVLPFLISSITACFVDLVRPVKTSGTCHVLGVHRLYFHLSMPWLACMAHTMYVQRHHSLQASILSRTPFSAMLKPASHERCWHRQGVLIAAKLAPPPYR